MDNWYVYYFSTISLFSKVHRDLDGIDCEVSIEFYHDYEMHNSFDTELLTFCFFCNWLFERIWSNRICVGYLWARIFVRMFDMPSRYWSMILRMMSATVIPRRSDSFCKKSFCGFVRTMDRCIEVFMNTSFTLNKSLVKG